MPFDQDPREEIESYPYYHGCDGNITFNSSSGIWECDTCGFFTNGADNGQAPIHKDATSEINQVWNTGKGKG